MPLTVLNVAFPFAPVGPDSVGGAEQIVSALDVALLDAGHRSIILACDGSTAAGELTTVPLSKELFTDDVRSATHRDYRRTLAQLLSNERVDVLHFHGVDFLDYAPHDAPPTLVTLHLPPESYRTEVFSRLPGRYLQCVSVFQRDRCPQAASHLEVIPNGVDLHRFRPSATKGDYAVLLGRICPEKGVHLAIDAAVQSRVPLVIAGRVFRYPEHERYFEEVIKPKLRPGIELRGAVGAKEKDRLLAEARCLIVASTIPETSSLAAMEALASGTPVVALRSGALPEIVRHGETGFLAEGVAELADGMRRATAIAAETCRREAEARFSVELMSRRYLALYERLGAAPSRHRPLRVEVGEITSPVELHAIEPSWRELWFRCSRATVFQTSEWLGAWRRHFATEDAHLLCFRRGSRLVGLLPLFGWDRGEERVASLWGAGVSDYQDALFADGEEQACADALEAWLAGPGARWDQIELSELREGASPLLSLSARIVDRRRQDPCPGIPLPRAGGSLGDALPRAQLESVLYARRKAERDHGLVVEHARPETTDVLLDHLVRLHTARWRARGESGALESEVTRSFHRDVARKLLEAGALLLFGVRLGDQIAGVLYGFFDRGATRSYLTAFDPRFGRYSPGTLAIAAAIELALARGDEVFDCLRGGEPYKYLWGARDLEHVCAAGLRTGPELG
jgi:CelD/BcsL family acetyltransferase involved in cellulose biosynthesis